jgi:hypothetical protein
LRPFRSSGLEKGLMVIKRFSQLAAACALVGIGFSTSAQATCWSAQDAEAAQVRDFDTMLMVASLRCRLSGQDFIQSYNAFVRESRPALSAMNVRLRAHFGNADAYDRYVTGIANRYGAGTDGLTCRDMASIVKAARSEGGAASGLVRLAKSSDVQPLLPGGRCSMTVAQAR